MKLYVKEKIFSLKKNFSVKDENGKDKYFLQPCGSLFDYNLSVTDAQGVEITTYHVNYHSNAPTLSVFVGGEEVAQVRTEFVNNCNARYVVDGLEWEIAHRSMISLKYDFNRCGQTIGCITLDWPSVGDGYCLELDDPAHEIMALAVVMLIDYRREQNS